MDKEYEVIICIVNNGYSEIAMEAAKAYDDELDKKMNKNK